MSSNLNLLKTSLSLNLLNLSFVLSIVYSDLNLVMMLIIVSNDLKSSSPPWEKLASSKLNGKKFCDIVLQISIREMDKIFLLYESTCASHVQIMT